MAAPVLHSGYTPETVNSSISPAVVSVVSSPISSLPNAVEPESKRSAGTGSDGRPIISLAAMSVSLVHRPANIVSVVSPETVTVPVHSVKSSTASLVSVHSSPHRSVSEVGSRSLAGLSRAERQAYHRQQLAMEEEEEKAEEELAKLTQFQGEDGAQHLGVSGWLPGSSAQTLHLVMNLPTTQSAPTALHPPVPISEQHLPLNVTVPEVQNNAAQQLWIQQQETAAIRLRLDQAQIDSDARLAAQLLREEETRLQKVSFMKEQELKRQQLEQQRRANIESNRLSQQAAQWRERELHLQHQAVQAERHLGTTT